MGALLLELFCRCEVEQSSLSSSTMDLLLLLLPWCMIPRLLLDPLSDMVDAAAAVGSWVELLLLLLLLVVIVFPTTGDGPV